MRLMCGNQTTWRPLLCRAARAWHLLPFRQSRCFSCAPGSKTSDEADQLSGQQSDGVSSGQQSSFGSGDLEGKAMAVLCRVFQSHPSALRLHHEMTKCIACGEAEQAADLASVLANVVKRVSLSAEARQNACAQPAQGVSSSTLNKATSPDDTMPVATLEDVNFSIESVRRSLSSASSDWAIKAFIDGESDTKNQTTLGDGVLPTAVNHHNAPFWKRPDALRVTLLETAFEMGLSDGDDDPLKPGSSEAEAVEKQRMALLDAYLTREGKRWGQQKAAVGRVVLTTAKRLGIVPENIHTAQRVDGERFPDTRHDRFNVLKHCNLIVRGECPEVMELQCNTGSNGSEVHAAATAELEVLARRMEERGTPLSPIEKEMALYELVITKNRVRYVVGLHRELQIAL
uniref:Uncharacterized protein n=1 Tax=Trypanosoma vivax (strain Y486) TaxID=1055687 RepID=G0U480_TRYVY|nr:conserved hypothetical protein [Trypanosoma vivax Y486]